MFYFLILALNLATCSTGSRILVISFARLIWVLKIVTGAADIGKGNSVESSQIGLSRPYHLKFFKGCLPQILFGPFFNTYVPYIKFVIRALCHIKIYQALDGPRISSV